MQQKKTVDITLTEEEIVEIVRLLDFAKAASTVALLHENNLREEDIRNLKQNINNSTDLGDTLIAALDIGNVDKTKIN